MSLAVVAEVSAGEFRVDTQVFAGDKLVAEHVTLFAGGCAYDLAGSPISEAVIVDATNDRFVLLDPRRKLACQLTKESILSAVAGINVRAATMPALVRFAAEPKFEISGNAERQVVLFESALLKYACDLLTPGTNDAVASYRDFADWSARLSASQPGGWPPAARLVVNTRLSDMQSLPRRITKSYRNQTDDPFSEVSSRHAYRWQLTAADRRQMDEVRSWSNSFQAVDLITFRTPTAAGRAASRR